MSERYERLVADFCSLVGLDPEYVHHGRAIAVDGIDCCLVHNDEAGADMLFLYVDFGPPPMERQDAVLYELLKRNYLQFAGKGPSFTISPVTGHVVYVEHFRLGETRPELLASSMSYLASLATDWRETHFLSGKHQVRMSSVADSN